MGKYNADKGSTLWTMWADIFLLWQDQGNCDTKQEFDEWYKAARKLDEKYAETDEGDLCREILIALGDVIDERYLSRHDEQKGMQGITDNRQL